MLRRPVFKRSECCIVLLVVDTEHLYMLSDVFTFSAIALNISTEIRSESTSRTCKGVTELAACRFFILYNLISSEQYQLKQMVQNLSPKYCKPRVLHFSFAPDWEKILGVHMF